VTPKQSILTFTLTVGVLGSIAQDKMADTRITFLSDRSEKLNQIFSMAPDGSGVIQITKNEGPKYDPAVSRDGKKVIVTARKEGQLQLCMLDSDGSNEKQLTETDKCQNVATCWFPDGKRVLFCSNRDGQFEIFVGTFEKDALKADKLALTFPKDWAGGGVGFPTVSADGKKVAFAGMGAEGGDTSFEILIADEKGNVTRLTKNDVFDSSPNWSVDGKKLAFVSSRDGNDEIYVMDADGRNVHRLTKNDAMDTTPVWSPDGKSIAFVSARDGNSEIYLMNADGSNPRNISNNPAKDNTPRWTRTP